jgi:hypothetical protein
VCGGAPEKKAAGGGVSPKASSTALLKDGDSAAEQLKADASLLLEIGKDVAAVRSQLQDMSSSRAARSAEAIAVDSAAQKLEAIAVRLHSAASVSQGSPPTSQPVQRQRRPHFVVEEEEPLTKQACCSFSFGGNAPTKSGGSGSNALMETLFGGCSLCQTGELEQPLEQVLSLSPRAAAAPAGFQPAVSSTGAGEVRLRSLEGVWICVDTFGLDEFLQENGISKMRRMAASRAPWPKWEFFTKDGDRLLWKNHNMLGVQQELIDAGGPEYHIVDGEKNELICRAFWDQDTLVIERLGKPGRFREERRLNAQGELEFVLKSLEEGKTCSWGRKFRREKA